MTFVCCKRRPALLQASIVAQYLQAASHSFISLIKAPQPVGCCTKARQLRKQSYLLASLVLHVFGCSSKPLAKPALYKFRLMSLARRKHEAASVCRCTTVKAIAPNDHKRNVRSARKCRLV